MRKILYAVSALLLTALAYIVTPFVAAWSIHEAIRNGNADTLERKIEWDSVRLSLRQSLTQVALGQPGDGRAETADVPAKPGLWRRIKNNLSKSAVNTMVDRYVTPAGLPQLFSVRKAYRNVSGETARLEAMAWQARFAEFWSRLKRAEFKSPAVFEIEMADRNDPTRHYIGLLELRGVEWKLTELRVRLVRETDLPLVDSAGTDPA